MKCEQCKKSDWLAKLKALFIVEDKYHYEYDKETLEQHVNVFVRWYKEGHYRIRGSIHEINFPGFYEAMEQIKRRAGDFTAGHYHEIRRYQEKVHQAERELIALKDMIQAKDKVIAQLMFDEAKRNDVIR